MYPYISGTLWWERWPLPARMAAISLLATQISTTWRLEVMSWCPCLLTAYHPRGGQTSVLRVHQPASRGECCCGCEQMGSMPGGCARAGCTGREARRRTETNPTSWRETSPVNCSTRRTTSQVRGHKLKSAQDLWSTITCARKTKTFSLFWVSMLLFF